jgi:hypothetical protein
VVVAALSSIGELSDFPLCGGLGSDATTARPGRTIVVGLGESLRVVVAALSSIGELSDFPVWNLWVLVWQQCILLLLSWFAVSRSGWW